MKRGGFRLSTIGAGLLLGSHLITGFGVANAADYTLGYFEVADGGEYLGNGDTYTIDGVNGGDWAAGNAYVYMDTGASHNLAGSNLTLTIGNTQADPLEMYIPGTNPKGDLGLTKDLFVLGGSNNKLILHDGTAVGAAPADSVVISLGAVGGVVEASKYLVNFTGSGNTLTVDSGSSLKLGTQANEIVIENVNNMDGYVDNRTNITRGNGANASAAGAVVYVGASASNSTINIGGKVSSPTATAGGTINGLFDETTTGQNATIFADSSLTVNMLAGGNILAANSVIGKNTNGQKILSQFTGGVYLSGIAARGAGTKLNVNMADNSRVSVVYSSGANCNTCYFVVKPADNMDVTYNGITGIGTATNITMTSATAGAEPSISVYAYDSKNTVASKSTGVDTMMASGISQEGGSLMFTSAADIGRINVLASYGNYAGVNLGNAGAYGEGAQTNLMVSGISATSSVVNLQIGSDITVRAEDHTTVTGTTAYAGRNVFSAGLYLTDGTTGVVNINGGDISTTTSIAGASATNYASSAFAVGVDISGSNGVQLTTSNTTITADLTGATPGATSQGTFFEAAIVGGVNSTVTIGNNTTLGNATTGGGSILMAGIASDGTTTAPSVSTLNITGTNVSIYAGGTTGAGAPVTGTMLQTPGEASATLWAAGVYMVDDVNSFNISGTATIANYNAPVTYFGGQTSIFSISGISDATPRLAKEITLNSTFYADAATNSSFIVGNGNEVTVNAQTVTDPAGVVHAGVIGFDRLVLGNGSNLTVNNGDVSGSSNMVFTLGASTMSSITLTDTDANNNYKIVLGSGSGATADAATNISFLISADAYKALVESKKTGTAIAYDPFLDAGATGEIIYGTTAIDAMTWDQAVAAGYVTVQDSAFVDYTVTETGESVALSAKMISSLDEVSGFTVDYGSANSAVIGMSKLLDSGLISGNINPASTPTLFMLTNSVLQSQTQQEAVDKLQAMTPSNLNSSQALVAFQMQREFSRTIADSFSDINPKVRRSIAEKRAEAASKQEAKKTGVSSGDAIANGKFWFDIFYNNHKANSVQGYDSSVTDTTAFIMGYNHTFDAFEGGISFAHTTGNTDFNKSASDTEDTLGNYLNLAGKYWISRRLFFDGYVSAGSLTSDGQREMTPNTAPLTVKTSYNYGGNVFAGKVGAGYAISVPGGIKITPKANIAYMNYKQNAYTESGESGVALQDSNLSGGFIDASVKLDYITTISKGSTVTFYALAGLEFNTLDPQAYSMGISSLPGEFVAVVGPNMDSMYYNVEAGIEGNSKDINFSLSWGYTGSAETSSNTVQVEIGYRF